MLKLQCLFILIALSLSACTLTSNVLIPTANPQASPTTQEILPGSKDEILPENKGGILPGTKDGILPESKGGILPGTKDEILPGTKDEILPETKDEILPGSKGGILPGSKNEVTLTLEVRLPDAGSFVTQSLEDDFTTWTVQIEDQSYALSNLSQSQQSDERVLKFELQKVQFLSANTYHQIKIYSTQKILQTAALIPTPQTISEPLHILNSDTFAQWFLANEYEFALNQPIAQITIEEFQQLVQMPETKELSAALKADYLKSRGKKDPTQDPCIKQQAQNHSQKLLNLMNKKPVNPNATVNAGRCSQSVSDPEMPFSSGSSSSSNGNSSSGSSNSSNGNSSSGSSNSSNGNSSSGKNK